MQNFSRVPSGEKNNYRKVVNETDYRIAAQELKNAGYATDPSYAGKLISLIEAYKLYEWDAVSNTTNSVLENEGVESQNPKADLAITGLNNATSSYDLVISNLVAPRGFKEVLVPTWSEKNVKMISSVQGRLSKLMETIR